MNSFDDAKSLLKHSKTELAEIEIAYQKALKEREINSQFKIKIKDFLEHMRSALDYCSFEIFKRFCISKNPKHRVYFPYAEKGVTPIEFRKKRIATIFPDLDAKRPDIVKLFETWQHWNSQFEWMPIFMNLNNKSKHEKMSAYAMDHGHEVRISGGPTLIMEQGAGIKFGPDAKIIHNGKVIEAGNKRLDAYTAPELLGAENVSVSAVWNNIKFDMNGESVCTFLGKVLAGVCEIVQNLSSCG